MYKTVKGFVSGFIIASLLTSTVLAAPIQKQIKVTFNQIKVYANNKLLGFKDAKGNKVEPFIYNNTVYLPAKAFAQALGKDVQWNSAQNTLTITEKQKSTNSSRIPTIDGIAILPSDNFWNTPVDTMKVHPNSNQYISSIGKARALHPDFGTVWEGNPIGIPYNVVPDNQPMVKVSFDYADESDQGPYPIPASPLIEAGSDRHMLILQKGSNILYELYAAEKQNNDTWHAGSGAIWHLDKNEARHKGWTSADASGLAILPGLVRWEEVYEKKEINHAIRITVSKIQKSYIQPASHTGGQYTGTSYPPMGLRLRLKQDFDISKFDPHIQVILKAFKKYGVVIADVGSDMYISGVPDQRWDDELLGELKKITADSFEAVYTGDTVPYR